MQPPLVYLDESESNALRFAAQMRVIDTDGKVFTDRTRIYVNDASYAVIAIAAGTNYAGYMQPRDRDVNRVVDRLADEFTAAGHWDDALRAHIAGYQALYGRVKLDLDEEITGALPTSQRFALNGGGVFDPSVGALAAQYARYLIISGSRPGTQAENLQGIWNASVQPPWSSNYTTNINVQMNYWPAEIFALSECHGAHVRSDTRNRAKRRTRRARLLSFGRLGRASQRGPVAHGRARVRRCGVVLLAVWRRVDVPAPVDALRIHAR